MFLSIFLKPESEILRTKRPLETKTVSANESRPTKRKLRSRLSQILRTVRIRQMSDSLSISGRNGGLYDTLALRQIVRQILDMRIWLIIRILRSVIGLQ